MLIQDLRRLFELADERDRRLESWLRYLVGLASGALTVLISLQKDTPLDPDQSICLKATWGMLGLGILTGSIALYGRVFAQRGLVKRWVEART